MTGISKLRRTAGLALAVGLSTTALPAAAEDYPFSGLYWPSFDDADTGQIDKLCALTFLDQRSDGSWSAYHVDLAEFRKSKTIRYSKLSEGTCTYAPETRVETCVISMDKSYPDADGDVVYDVLTAVLDDRVETVMIDAASGWETVMQNGGTGAEGAQLTYLRCPFPEAAVKALISPDVTDLPPDELNALRYPEADMLGSPEVAQLVQMLRRQ